jgi:uncharacterized secreted protein with C-terminal beta-propeller domain
MDKYKLAAKLKLSLYERKLERDRENMKAEKRVVHTQEKKKKEVDILASLKHRPKYAMHEGKMTYFKKEMNDDSLFRKSRSLSINHAALEKCDVVIIHIRNRDVWVRATKQDILDHKEFRTYNSELKCYYPIEDWEVIRGDVNWTLRIPKELK